ncbi:MAG: YybH family protein [bacterium]
MKALLLKLTMIFCLLALFISQPFAQENLSRIKKDIEDINTLLARATIEDDFDTMLLYYHDEVVVMPNFYETIRGKANWMRLTKNAIAEGRQVKSANFTTIDLWTCGDAIFEVGKYGMSVVMPGAAHPFADYGKYFTMWQRQKDGELKIKMLIWNTDMNLRAIIDQFRS